VFLCRAIGIFQAFHIICHILRYIDTIFLLMFSNRSSISIRTVAV
jgi:hypothetical protein